MVNACVMRGHFLVIGDTSKPTGTPTLFCVHIRKQQRMFDLRIA